MAILCTKVGNTTKKIICRNENQIIICDVFEDGKIEFFYHKFSPQEIKQIVIVQGNFDLFYNNIKDEQAI